MFNLFKRRKSQKIDWIALYNEYQATDIRLYSVPINAIPSIMDDEDLEKALTSDPSKAVFSAGEENLGIVIEYMTLDAYLDKVRKGELCLSFWGVAFEFTATPENAEMVYQLALRPFLSQISTKDFFHYAIVDRNNKYELVRFLEALPSELIYDFYALSGLDPNRPYRIYQAWRYIMESTENGRNGNPGSSFLDLSKESLS